MDTENHHQNNEKEIDLADFVRVLLKKKHLILLFLVGATALAVSFHFLMPQRYKIATSLEVSRIDDLALEDPQQIMEKIEGDVYGIKVREKLNIGEIGYPKIKVENPQNTNLVRMRIASAETEKAKRILTEINSLILKDHEEKIQQKKGFFEENIKLLENNIKVTEKDITRIKTKIGFLEGEKENLEAKITALQKVLPYEQDPGSQFALFDTKEKLALKKQEIEDQYLKMNSLETNINALKNEINLIKEKIENVTNTKVIKSPIVSEKPLGPSIVFILAIALLSGLLTGILFAFLVEWWDKNKLRMKG